MALNIYYGNKDYYINEGRKEGLDLGREEGLCLGRKEQRSQYINKYANQLMEKNKGSLSEEAALQEAENFFDNLDN